MRHLTGPLLDRLTHRVHILEMNGESYYYTGITFIGQLFNSLSAVDIGIL